MLHGRYIFPNGKWRGVFFSFQNTPHELNRYCTDGFSFCAGYPYLILCGVWVRHLCLYEDMLGKPVLFVALWDGGYQHGYPPR